MFREDLEENSRFYYTNQGPNYVGNSGSTPTLLRTVSPKDKKSGKFPSLESKCLKELEKLTNRSDLSFKPSLCENSLRMTQSNSKNEGLSRFVKKKSKKSKKTIIERFKLGDYKIKQTLDMRQLPVHIEVKIYPDRLEKIDQQEIKKSDVLLQKFIDVEKMKSAAEQMVENEIELELSDRNSEVGENEEFIEEYNEDYKEDLYKEEKVIDQMTENQEINEEEVKCVVEMLKIEEMLHEEIEETLQSEMYEQMHKVDAEKVSENHLIDEIIEKNLINELVSQETTQIDHAVETVEIELHKDNLQEDSQILLKINSEAETIENIKFDEAETKAEIEFVYESLALNTETKPKITKSKTVKEKTEEENKKITKSKTIKAKTGKDIKKETVKKSKEKADKLEDVKTEDNNEKAFKRTKTNEKKEIKIETKVNEDSTNLIIENNSSETSEKQLTIFSKDIDTESIEIPVTDKIGSEHEVVHALIHESVVYEDKSTESVRTELKEKFDNQESEIIEKTVDVEGEHSDVSDIRINEESLESKHLMEQGIVDKEEQKVESIENQEEIIKNLKNEVENQESHHTVLTEESKISSETIENTDQSLDEKSNTEVNKTTPAEIHPHQVQEIALDEQKKDPTPEETKTSEEKINFTRKESSISESSSVKTQPEEKKTTKPKPEDKKQGKSKEESKKKSNPAKKLSFKATINPGQTKILNFMSDEIPEEVAKSFSEKNGMNKEAQKKLLQEIIQLKNKSK